MNNNASIREHIYMYINKWLNDNSISESVFAEAVGVSVTSVRRWRTGKCIPDIDLFPRVCNFMNVSILEFMGFNDTEYLSEKQSQLLKKYQDEETFRNLVDRYKDDTEFKVALDTFIKLMK